MGVGRVRGERGMGSWGTKDGRGGEGEMEEEVIKKNERGGEGRGGGNEGGRGRRSTVN